VPAGPNSRFAFDGQIQRGNCLVANVVFSGIDLIDFQCWSCRLDFNFVQKTMAGESVPGERQKHEVTLQCHFKIMATAEAVLLVV
jgi:hypothetical protein